MIISWCEYGACNGISLWRLGGGDRKSEGEEIEEKRDRGSQRHGILVQEISQADVR
jgi:hypothetical protein